MASRALGALSEADLAPLDVSADLAVSVDGQELGVESYTDRIVLAVPSFGVAVALFRRVRGMVPSVARALAAADLSVVVRVNGNTVAVLGVDARSGWLSRRLDAPVAVSFGGAFAALVREIL